MLHICKPLLKSIYGIDQKFFSDNFFSLGRNISQKETFALKTQSSYLLWSVYSFTITCDFLPFSVKPRGPQLYSKEKGEFYI